MEIYYVLLCYKLLKIELQQSNDSQNSLLGSIQDLHLFKYIFDESYLCFYGFILEINCFCEIWLFSILLNFYFSSIKPFFSPKQIKHWFLYAHTIKYTFIPLFRAIFPSTPQLLMSVATSLCRPRLAASGGGGGGWLGAGLRAALRSAQCCSGVPRVRCLRHTSLSYFYFTFYVFKVVQELFY